jgi:hypothetical protein
MYKIITNLTVILIFFLISLILILSSVGIETSKFNSFISKKINKTNNNIKTELITIKFKLDIKELSLFLETNNPKIDYRKNIIPTQSIKVYIDFVSLIKSEPKISKIVLIFNQLDIEQLKKISVNFKPSNFTSFIKNKIKQGKIDTELEFYLDSNNQFDNFIIRGSISDFSTEIIKNIYLKKSKFNFFADKSDIILKNISGEAGPFKIENGDLKANLSSEILLESNFKTKIKYKNNSSNYEDIIRDKKFFKNIGDLEAELNNNFFINFDKTYKVKKYNYKSNGKITKANLKLNKSLDSFFSNKTLKNLSLINSDIKMDFSSKNNNTKIIGNYSLDKDSPLPFELESNMDGDLVNLKLNADYSKPFELELINYKKHKDLIANIFVNLEKRKDNIKIKKINLTEGTNSIFAENIIFDKGKFISFKKISVKTSENGKKNNDFSILYKKMISIKGKQFDASNLPKILNQKTTKKTFSNINKDIEIDFVNINAPLSENLKNFKLIGKIEKGKFTKIISKGDFGENNFLDIKMKKDFKNEKKYLEIYSDLTKPLLTEYSFFKGLTGGKLLYTSIIDKDDSTSKLKIENFKVINAPGMLKLLSLADLGGLADIAEGEGLSFDILEINMEKNNSITKFNEILALGPSISVLMEGYQDSKVTSLRGTLVPAKTLNKMISKIPVLGDIIIPKEVGEGLFGISFKMKGPPGKIKTTINPIKTLTPRFIQKIIDRNKNSK